MLRRRAGRLRARLGRLGIAFLLISTGAGSLLILGIPPGLGLDEPQHFARAWSISRGDLLAVGERGGRVGNIMSRCEWAFVGRLYEPVITTDDPMTLRQLNAPNPCEAGADVFVPHENTAVNSPVGYLPQAAALALARGLGLPTGVTFYAGRFAGLLLYVVLGTAALALAPRGRLYLFAIGVFPMSLLQAATYSADTAAIGFALLLAALVLRAVAGSGRAGREPDVEPSGWRRSRRWVGPVAVAIALSLTKNTLVVAAAMLLLVPTTWARSRRSEVAARVGAVAACGLAAAGWYLMVRHVSLGPARAPLVLDPATQSRAMLTQPKWFARVLLTTATAQAGGVLRTTAWMFNPYRRPGAGAAPTWLAGLAVAHLALAGAADWGRRRTLDLAGRLAALLPVAVLVGGFGLSVLALWVTWTQVGSPVVEGIQGRYLLPLLPFLAVSVAIARHPARRRSIEGVTLLASVGLLAALGIAVWLRYWS